jgi:hypothetical protein
MQVTPAACISLQQGQLPPGPYHVTPFILTFCSAETIVRTVEKLAAQNRVLMCPICDRRLVQIEQMVAQQQNAAVLSSLTAHIGVRHAARQPATVA